jgi:predicted ester cyclase
MTPSPGEEDTVAHDYKAICDRVYTAFNTGIVKDLDGVFAPGFVEHEELPGVTATGQDVPKEMVRIFHQAFPDVHFDVLDILGEGDRLCVWYRLTGTNTGPFMGMPATGRAIDVQGFDYVTLDERHRVTEHWGVSQDLKMMTQLGLIPEQSTTIDLTESEHSPLPN